MKIIHIIPDLKKGGAERLCLDICRILQKNQDHDVLLINFRPENDYSFLAENINRVVIPTKFTPSITGKHKKDVRDLQKLINAFQPDIIHAHLFETLMVLTQVKYSARLVIHFHDNMVQFENFSWKTLLNKRKFTNYFEKRLANKRMKQSEVIFIGISTDTFNYISRVLPRSSRKVKLVNGIDCHRFMKPAHWIEDLDALSQEHIELTMIGSLVDKKGQSLAIETIAELRKRGMKAVLNLIGDGPNRSELEDLAKTLSIEGSVRFHGNVDYPENYLWRSFIYLHTAKYEPLGLVLLEAMAAGLPIITLDGRGNRDLIEHDKNGYMIYEKNPELFSDKIQELWKNPAEYERISNYAQRYAQQHDIKNYVDSLLTIYF